MPTRLLLALVAPLAAAGACLAQEPLRFARHPSIAPDGTWITFDQQGDIRRVDAAGGIARPLTVHEARDHQPRISPDGKWIAFMSDRFGGIDVLVIPAGGGRPARLTRHADDDVLMDWLPDASGVLFGSRREHSHLSSAVYRVGLDGGTPVLHQAALGFQAAPSPDGRLTAYVAR